MLHNHLPGMGVISFIDCVTIRVSSNCSVVHHSSCCNHRIHLHKLLVPRNLFFQHFVYAVLQLTQRDVRVDSQVLDRLCDALHRLR